MLICGRDYLVSEDDDGTRIEATADTAFCASLRACWGASLVSLECDWTVYETCKRLLSGVKKICFG